MTGRKGFRFRDLGTGFAAPGGEFTRALYEWSLTPGGSFLHKMLEKRRVVELGAGMMPYGYALAATCGAKNFVAVEPFYADKQRASVKAIIEEQGSLLERIPYKVEGRDMLDYLKDEADELLCVVACGIEDCILPSSEYRKQVEGEIYRVLERDAFFLVPTVIYNRRDYNDGNDFSATSQSPGRGPPASTRAQRCF